MTENEDYYWEGGFMVFTAKYHLRRGSCCGSKCRHCPYEPRWAKGVSAVATEPAKTPQTDQLTSADSPK